MRSEHGERLEDNGLRQRLIEGSFLKSLREPGAESASLRSDDELESLLQHTLAGRDPGADLHVFGCGSLMWNPAMKVKQGAVGRVAGWHRSFCFELLVGRGSREAPGAMLALDRGGACKGVLYTIEASCVADEVRLLWRREMIAGSYRARWLDVRVGSESVRALAFVADRKHRRYLGQAPLAQVADLIRHGRGAFGTSRDYFDSTLQVLRRLGIRDAGMERLAAVVLEADAREASGPSQGS